MTLNAPKRLKCSRRFKCFGHFKCFRRLSAFKHFGEIELPRLAIASLMALLILAALPAACKPLDVSEAYGRSGRFEAFCRVESHEGYLVVKLVCNGEPPYRAYVIFAGKLWNYTFKRDELVVEVEHPDVGEQVVKVLVVDSLGRVVELKLVVGLYQVDVESDLYYSIIPLSFLLALLPEMLAYAPKKLRSRVSVNTFTASSVLALGVVVLPREFWYMGTTLLVYSIVTTLVVLLVAFLTNRRIMKNTLEYILITSLLIGMTIYLANPLPLIVVGVGNAIWLTCVLLFPSEWRSLERMIKSVNVLYAVFMVVMNFLISVATQISAYLLEPSWGMVKALIVNISLIANLIMALPIVASLFTFAKLYATVRVEHKETL